MGSCMSGQADAVRKTDKPNTAPTSAPVLAAAAVPKAGGRKPPAPAKGKSSELKSALIIQRWFRRQRAVLELRHRVAWQIFQKLEYDNEAEQLRLQSFFESILHNDSALRLAVGHQSMDATPLHPALAADIDFARAHVPLSVTPEGSQVLIEQLKRGVRPSSDVVLSLLAATYTRLQTLPSLTRISTAITGQVCVVGDLHGQFMDLLIIFDKNGLPSEANPYLINGDFVDRGSQSVEIFIVLFYFFLLYPSAMSINRGNHEDFMLSKRHGFEKEVQQKYGSAAPAIMRGLSAVFTLLPLAALVDDQVLVVHAGVSSATTLAAIEAIDRAKYPSVLTLAQMTSPGAGGRLTAEEDLVVALLWNDPGAVVGCVPNVRRNGGSIWGPNVTRAVCTANNLKLIIRSHECQSDGFRYTHSAQLLTLFSASNYYSSGSNLGAFVKLSSSLPPRIVQFVHTPHYDVAIRARPTTLRYRATVTEEAAIAALAQAVLASRPDIFAACSAKDPKNTGELTLGDWSAIMSNFFDGIPWRHIHRRFVKPAARAGCVLYKTCLQDRGDRSEAVLYPQLGRLEYIFRIVDTDRSGTLTRDEVARALTLFNSVEKENKATADRILDLLDFDHNGLVDFNEFAEGYRLLYKTDRPATPVYAAGPAAIDSSSFPPLPPYSAQDSAQVEMTARAPTPVYTRVPTPVETTKATSKASIVFSSHMEELLPPPPPYVPDAVETGPPPVPLFRPGVGSGCAY